MDRRIHSGDLFQMCLDEFGRRDLAVPNQAGVLRCRKAKKLEWYHCEGSFTLISAVRRGCVAIPAVFSRARARASIRIAGKESANRAPRSVLNRTAGRLRILASHV